VVVENSPETEGLGVAVGSFFEVGVRKEEVGNCCALDSHSHRSQILGNALPFLRIHKNHNLDHTNHTAPAFCHTDSL